METTLATILITVFGTLAVISLGVIIWVIAQLNRRVSKLEGLGLANEIKHERELENIYREFENSRREHDEKLKEFSQQSNQTFENVWRKFDDSEKEINLRVDEVHRKIDDNSENLERNLDKRFDSVYRKFYSFTNNDSVTAASN